MHTPSGIAFIACLFLVLPANAAQDPAGPRAVLERGVTAYLKADATAAMEAWIKGSAMESNTQALTQANALRQIEDFYGKVRGYDLVKEITVAPRAKTLYFTLNYEKGIAFGRLNAYRQDDGTWVTTSFFFHTEAPQVFPPSLLGE